MPASETSPPTRAAPPRFHRLTIAEVRRETADAISVAFMVPPALAAAYSFRAGQYLTLRATLDGVEVRRTYSICSGIDDGELRIAIKRMEGGTFSVWAQDALRIGTRIDVMTPTGRFGIPPHDAATGRVHVAFAAGSGITPVLSIMKTVLMREPASRFFLFYGSRTTSEILFRGVIEDLKDTCLGRFSVFHVLSRERQDVAVLNGHLDQDKLNLLLRHILGGIAIDAVYVCGPTGMIANAEAAIAASGVPADRVHVERFASALAGRPRTATPFPLPLPPQAVPYAVAAIAIDGTTTEVSLAEGEMVLDAALRAGLDLPFACKGGMCCTCRAKLTEGSVAMAVNYSLEPWEMQAGFVLTCQARPTTARIGIDFDQQ